MSASTEKKLRKAAREAGTDKKLIAQQQQSQEKAKQKRRWTLGTIAVVLLVALILFLNSGVLFSSTALSVDDEDYSATEMSYYYANQFYYLANQYGGYSAMIGLDTSAGFKGLDKQPCPMLENGSWRDYFLQSAKTELIQEQALRDYAAENGIELSEEELANIELNFEGMDEYAVTQGYANGDKLMAANYGNDVDLSVVRQAYRNATLATKTLNDYTDSLSFSDSEKQAKYDSFEGMQDYFDYAYYHVYAETTETTNEEGETVSEVSEEALAEAEKTAKDILAAYKAGKGEDAFEKLDAAVAANVEGATATRSKHSQASGFGVYKDWMLQDHETGDATTMLDASEEGYYVVVYISRDDNDYNVAQVRHILVKALADENGEYTAQAKAEAKAKAEELLAAYEAGEKTEESFAALASANSEDTGSSANGGLYDNVAKGQMVEEFDAFCFEDHKKGDTAIVYGESTSYAGYHVMYYVGEGENYALSLAGDSLETEAINAWIAELTEGYEATEGFGMRFVG